jgi:hypothetical protein
VLVSDASRILYYRVLMPYLDYVNNNPSAFANAYWNIAAVRVYQ